MRDVAMWLNGIGLGQYAELFAMEDIDFAVLPHLTEQDLEKLGIESLGHRKKLLAAIAILSRKRSSTSDGDGGVNVPGEAAATAERAKAERRQLTIMFCDLVDSTALSAELDPEDYRELITTFQEACVRPIRRYAGHVAKYLGDGILVYFGYPQAHEDDAERAGRAGLDIISAIERLSAPANFKLRCRIGIATGLVVVGDLVGEGVSEQQAVSGETPNLAARLQGIAEPNTAVVGESTYRLLGRDFECEALGLLALKGIREPVLGWRLVLARASESRFEAQHGEHLTEFVDREEEIDLLLRRWTQAKAGNGQVVLLSGEAGIGKSRLTQVLRERIADEPYTRLRYQCSPYHTSSALYPIIQQLEFAARFAPVDTPVQKLDKLEAVLTQSGGAIPEVAALFASLLSIPYEGRYPPLNLTPQRRKERTFEALVDQLAGLAERQPVLFILEDVHWADPTTCELVELTLARAQTLRALLVITYRPEFTSTWIDDYHATSISLGRLGRTKSARVAKSVMRSKALPASVLDQIVAKSDGVPLFLEELTKTVLEAGILEEQEDRYILTGPLPPLAIPATLQDSLAARLDRLAPVKEVAQIAAAIGREFGYALLAAVSPLPENELQDALNQLAASRLIHRRGNLEGTDYIFKHSLIRDAAYDSLLRSKRHQLHAQIAHVLDRGFPQTKALQPELVAHHFAAAGLPKKAAPYWLAAGQLSIARSAFREAEAHLSIGLDTITELRKDQTRDRLEFGLQSMMATTYLVTRGYASPEAEKAFARANELGKSAGEPAEHFRILFGMWAYYLVKGDMNVANERAKELSVLAQQEMKDQFVLLALCAQLLKSTYRAELEEAKTCAQKILSMYNNEEHVALGELSIHDPKVLAYMYLSHILWMQGFPDQSVQACQDSLQYAREIGRPFDVALALQWGGMPHLYRGDREKRRQWADECLVASKEYGFPFEGAYAVVWQAWATAPEHKAEDVLRAMKKGLKAALSTGSGIVIPYVLCLIAEVLGKLGRYQAALGRIGQALDQVNRWNERHHEAEIRRVKGEILAARGDLVAAEQCFRAAVEVARRQAAKGWELRAATSLARLWQSQNKTDKARELLSPLYGWFSEGFDTADLKDAKALLDELA